VRFKTQIHWIDECKGMNVMEDSSELLKKSRRGVALEKLLRHTKVYEWDYPSTTNDRCVCIRLLRDRGGVVIDAPL
jgi:hypothetical protein